MQAASNRSSTQKNRGFAQLILSPSHDRYRFSSIDLLQPNNFRTTITDGMTKSATNCPKPLSCCHGGIVAMVKDGF